ncbi:MAG: argininosuccinate lyase, partial [Acidimicrobiales bacterium]|nr:argininosuccinate lyase [Acidimicrobiales bacterium]
MTTLWHGRFADGPAEALWQFTVSLPFDQRLGLDDVVASKAHVRGLVRGDLLTKTEGDTLLAALDQVAKELADGSFVFV